MMEMETTIKKINSICYSFNKEQVSAEKAMGQIIDIVLSFTQVWMEHEC